MSFKLPLVLLMVMIASPPTEAHDCGWSIISEWSADLMEALTEYPERFIIGLQQLTTVGGVITVAAILLLFWAALVLMGCLDKTDSVKKVAGQFGKAKRDTNISNIQDRGDDMV